MASWTDAWQGNARNPKWVSNRLSAGGQNTGVWYSDVKNGKLYWKGQTINTESSWWGENMSLPVNAPGDLIIEAELRLERVTGVNRRMGVGFNQAGGATAVRYGTMLSWEGEMRYCGMNALNRTPLPGMPVKSYITPGTSDQIIGLRVVRKNGYVFTYGNNTFLGQYAYAPTITTVDIINLLFVGAQDIDIEGWCHLIRVWPSSVVL